MAATRGARKAVEAALGLAWLSQSGCHSVLRLLEQEGSEAIWRASRRRLLEWGMVASAVTGFEEKRRRFVVEEAEALLIRTDLRFLPYGSAHYPVELVHLRFPPAGLFVRAADAALEWLLAAPRVTIVGTRRATAYGLRTTEAFASAFAARAVAVVSGMALGVDGRAHQAALEMQGLTVAVLGCGADLVYPRRHRWLYEKIAEGGIILSELPPGTAPARWTFPHRNRLLAALGDAAIVVEASRTSGALQTANWALELGRPVFAVPGQIHADCHEGCNMLLYDGAIPALDPCVTVEDFLLQTRIERGQRRATDSPGRPQRGGGVGRYPLHVVGAGGEGILEALESGPSSVDGLVSRTGLTARAIMAALAELELGGFTTRAGPGIYIRAP
jgi:DNA processing protein